MTPKGLNPYFHGGPEHKYNYTYRERYILNL